MLLNKSKAFQEAIASGTIKVGDTFFVPSLLPGLPGQTSFQCVADLPEHYDFEVYFDGVRLSKVTATKGPTSIFKSLPWTSKSTSTPLAT